MPKNPGRPCYTMVAPFSTSTVIRAMQDLSWYEFGLLLCLILNSMDLVVTKRKGKLRYLRLRA